MKLKQLAHQINIVNHLQAIHLLPVYQISVTVLKHAMEKWLYHIHLILFA